MRVGAEVALMATAEKALADFIYFVRLGKRQMNDRINWGAVKRNKVEDILVNTFGVGGLG